MLENTYGRYISIGFSLLFIVIYSIKSKFKLNFQFYIIIVWVFFNSIISVYSYNNYYFSVLFQQIIWLLVLWISTQVEVKLIDVKKLEPVIVLFSILIIFIMLTFDNNYFSTILYMSSFFLIAFQKTTLKSIFTGFLIMFVFYIILERSRFLSMGIIIGVYLLIPYMNKFLYGSFFWLFSIFVYLIPNFYLSLYSSSNRNFLNQIIFEFTSKNLFSGRQSLWLYLDKLLSDNTLFGFGGDFVGGYLSVDTLFNRSTHNLFYFLRGQGGYFLLGLFLIFLFILWNQLYQFKDNKFVAVGASYIIALLFRSSFDLVLLANNFVDSLFLWAPIFVTLGINNYLKANKKTFISENLFKN